MSESLKSSASTNLRQLLGPRALKIIRAVPDPAERERFTNAFGACAHALHMIDAVDLTPHELADLETPNIAAWDALAPDVRNVLIVVRKTCGDLMQLFPQGDGSTDLDVLEQGAIGGNPSFRSGSFDIDSIVRSSTIDNLSAVGESLRTLVSVLDNEIRALGQKLRNPRVVGDRWFLLAELDQFLKQCAQCLEAIVATALSSLTNENLDDVLPRYVDATSRAIKLRSAVVDLSADVDKYNEGIARANGVEIAILAQGLIELLDTFSSSEVYRYLRPQDKQSIIMFRIFANNWEKNGAKEIELRHELEGFSKFLALMRELNWRDVLQDSDAAALDAAKSALEGGVDIQLVKPLLERTYGRTQKLDEYVRAVRRNIDPDRDALIAAINIAMARPG